MMAGGNCITTRIGDTDVLKTKYRTCRTSCDRNDMFAGSLQPTDPQDNSNM